MGAVAAATVALAVAAEVVAVVLKRRREQASDPTAEKSPRPDQISLLSSDLSSSEDAYFAARTEADFGSKMLVLLAHYKSCKRLSGELYFNTSFLL